jgi:hypothetical protein
MTNPKRRELMPETDIFFNIKAKQSIKHLPVLIPETGASERSSIPLNT